MDCLEAIFFGKRCELANQNLHFFAVFLLSNNDGLLLLSPYLLNFILLTKLEWLRLEGDLFMRLRTFIIASEHKYGLVAIQADESMVSSASDVDTFD